MKIRSAEFVKSAVNPADYPRDGLPQVPVIGRSNVGKSSLLNYLTGRRHLVRTSSVPGRTRAVQFFLVNRAFYLVDLPGLGYAKAGRSTQRSMESALRAYFESGERVVGVLYLVDMRLARSEVDRRALHWLLGMGRPLLVVATKADKVGGSRRREALRGLAQTYGLSREPLAVSSAKRRGAEPIWDRITDLLLADGACASE